MKQKTKMLDLRRRGVDLSKERSEKTKGTVRIFESFINTLNFFKETSKIF